MRVISQDGRVDMPYEKIAIYLSCEEIIAKHEETRYLLATYSTREKAIKAMEECRWTWWKHNGFMIFQFPADEDRSEDEVL